MPRTFARAFTAASNCFGTRMLICSSFFSNSNRAGLNCEKSRLDKSRARNASACLSVLRRGTFFVIGCNLLSMHIPGRHRTDEAALVLRPYREGHEYRPPRAGSSHRNQAVFVHRVLWIGRNAGPCANRPSISKIETPCFWHFARLPSSQSNLPTRKFIVARNYTTVYTFVNRKTCV